MYSIIIYLYQHQVFSYIVDGTSPEEQLSPHPNAKYVATDIRGGRHREIDEAAFGLNLESSNSLYVIIGGESRHIFRYTVGLL